MWLSLYRGQWNLSATGYSLDTFITAHKRSLQRLCFHRCLSVHMGFLGLCAGGGISILGVYVQGGSVWGSLSRGIGGVSIWGVSVWGVSVQGVSVWGVSVQGVSVWGISVQGVSVWGSLSRQRPPEQRPPYSNVPAVRILLEFILVLFCGKCKFLWIRED